MITRRINHFIRASLLITGLSVVLASSPALAATQNAAKASTDFQLPPGAVMHEIEVTAIVPHKRTIVVDNNDTIIEITSNTPQDVAPQVYRYPLSADSEISVTPHIQQQYQTILSGEPSGAGILYTSALSIHSGMHSTTPDRSSPEQRTPQLALDRIFGGNMSVAAADNNPESRSFTLLFTSLRTNSET